MVVEDQVDQHRGETHRRLVEQQQLRSGHQRPSDGEHLLLAAGHRPGLLGDALPQPREQLEHPLLVLGDVRLVLAQERAEVEVLGDGHAREDPPALG